MRTIFTKQIVLYLCTLIISFVLLGAVLSQVIRSYFTDQRIDYLFESGARVANILEHFGLYGIVDVRGLNNQISSMRQYLNAHLIIIDSHYKVIVSAEVLTDPERPIVSDELLPLMHGQSIVLHGNLENQLTEPMLTVGYPLTWNNTVFGALLISSSMTELESTIAEMYRMTLLCLAISGLFAFILIYFSCRTITKPLRQMNEAAKIIAGGDFEKRILVKSKDETGQLAESFNNMAESLQEQEKIRRAFIANISHDLRSPLTSMRGFLQAIDDGTIPPEKYQRYIHIILDESERLIKLSNDIIDINRTQEIQLAISAFDINGLIRDTVMQFEKRALDKALKINCRFAHERDTVSADPDKIRRVLYNLLDNAVKFVDTAGEIVIETTVTGTKVIIGVQDNGRGLSAEEQKRIFDRFYKADESRSEDKMGVGLGLSIVREFIHAHGESIAVVSEPGKGCLFTFSLPLSPSAS